MSVQEEIFIGYLKRRHSVSKLIVHLIFLTKYRRKLLDSAMIEQIRESFLSAAKRLEVEILEMDGEADHVHVLVAYPPKLSVSVLVNNLKSISSRYVRQLIRICQNRVIAEFYGHALISPVVLAAQQSKH